MCRKSAPPHHQVSSIPSLPPSTPLSNKHSKPIFFPQRKMDHMCTHYEANRKCSHFSVHDFHMRVFILMLSQNCWQDDVKSGKWTYKSPVEEIVKTFESITTVYQEDEFKTWILQKEVWPSLSTWPRVTSCDLVWLRVASRYKHDSSLMHFYRKK